MAADSWGVLGVAKVAGATQVGLRPCADAPSDHVDEVESKQAYLPVEVHG